MNDWQIVGNINPKSLTETRLQLHYAIQLMAAVGNFLTEPKPDDSHASLTWNSELKGFFSGLITAEQPCRVALEPVSLTSFILDAQGNQLAEFSLPQKNLNDGMNWLKQTLEPLGVNLAQLTFVTHPDDFPDSPLARGAAFESGDEAKRQELTAYFANTNLLLQALSTSMTGASPVRIWPHHFDIAVLISLPGTQKDEAASIGVGMSPGDGNYDEPYWYITPWPYPNLTNLPPLASDGTWHTKDWVGAILRASQLSPGEEQKMQVEAFLDSGMKASLELFK